MTPTPFPRPAMCSLDHIAARSVLASALLALSLALTGCATPDPVPVAKGKFRALNTGRWTPEPADLKGPRSPLPTNNQTLR